MTSDNLYERPLFLLRERCFHPTSKLGDFIKGSNHPSPSLAPPERCGRINHQRQLLCSWLPFSLFRACDEWSCNWSHLLEGWPNPWCQLQVRRPLDSVLIPCSKYLFPGEGPRTEGILRGPSATTGFRPHLEGAWVRDDLTHGQLQSGRRSPSG